MQKKALSGVMDKRTPIWRQTHFNIVDSKKGEFIEGLTTIPWDGYYA